MPQLACAQWQYTNEPDAHDGVALRMTVENMAGDGLTVRDGY